MRHSQHFGEYGILIYQMFLKANKILLTEKEILCLYNKKIICSLKISYKLKQLLYQTDIESFFKVSESFNIY